MSFIVRGRPPGTTTYRRRKRGKLQTYEVVTRRHRADCKVRIDPFSCKTAAATAMTVAMAAGWTDLYVTQLYHGWRDKVTEWRV